ncbi:hypothetical protein C1H46_022405 [Malus baccata]|uniref:Secreted protein n=1 Tax=Malus baccata TaxID=106549 RepID=A0A540LZS7_MALBA|nr:hypothetical protein C1H46_022405 [Malus baccata]
MLFVIFAAVEPQRVLAVCWIGGAPIPFQVIISTPASSACSFKPQDHRPRSSRKWRRSEVAICRRLPCGLLRQLRLSQRR